MAIKKVLVTGANGFLGTHLCRYLHEQEIEIHALGTQPPITGIYHSIPFDDRASMRDLLTKISPDAIIHLAGVAVTSSISSYYEINVLFAANLIGALQEWGNNGCPTLLVGTSAEYGKIEPGDIPIKETTPAKPYDHYGISKLAQTLMGLNEARRGWPLIMVRPFNIIGPGMPGHLVVQSLVQQLCEIKMNQAPPILKVGNISPQRDFVNVSDVVESLWCLSQAPQAFGEIINVCSGVGTSVESILNRILRLTNVDVKTQIDPQKVKPVDIPIHVGSYEKLKALTGYIPKTDIETSLKTILRYEGLLNPMDQ